MIKWLRNLLIVAVLLLLGLGAFWGYRQYQSWQEYKTQEESTVLLEKIRTVAKLITVEGQFSEIINYKNYWGYDWAPFRKKALVRVQARVSVGYDLGKMQVETFPEEKRLRLAWDSRPEILSIEHELDYYDLQEGAFNNLSETDYNRINSLAVDQIRNKAEKSGLYESAAQQADEMLELIRFMVETMAWELEVVDKRPAFRQ